MAVHCIEFPPWTYKKKHRHGVGAHVIVLNGQGYSLLSFEGEKEPRRSDNLNSKVDVGSDLLVCFNAVMKNMCA